MTTFLRSLVLLTLAFHISFFLAVAEALKRIGAPAHWLIAALATGGGVALFVGRARAGMPDRRRHEAVLRFVDIPYFIHWCATVFAAIPSVVGTLVWVGIDLAHGRAPHYHGVLYLGAYGAGLIVCGYGILIRRRLFHVVEVDTPVFGLPAAFEGYRIAHLSDLHIGALTPKSWGDRWVVAANRKQADLAVVTGDMVTSGTDFHEDIAHVVGALTAPDGVFVSMGNHDYFGEGEPLVSLLERAGTRVLRNDGQMIERGGERLFLAGVDDTWTRRANMDRALAGRAKGVATVLLAHDPDMFPKAVERGVELVLSGHTHGGQIAMPFFAQRVSFSHIAHRFHLGLYRMANSTLYVHPGLGTTGPPMRLGVAPAVVILRLRAAAAAQ